MGYAFMLKLPIHAILTIIRARCLHRCELRRQFLTYELKANRTMRNGGHGPSISVSLLPSRFFAFRALRLHRGNLGFFASISVFAETARRRDTRRRKPYHRQTALGSAGALHLRANLHFDLGFHLGLISVSISVCTLRTATRARLRRNLRGAGNANTPTPHDTAELRRNHLGFTRFHLGFLGKHENSTINHLGFCFLISFLGFTINVLNDLAEHEEPFCP